MVFCRPCLFFCCTPKRKKLGDKIGIEDGSNCLKASIRIFSKDVNYPDIPRGYPVWKGNFLFHEPWMIKIIGNSSLAHSALDFYAIGSRSIIEEPSGHQYIRRGRNPSPFRPRSIANQWSFTSLALHWFLIIVIIYWDASFRIFSRCGSFTDQFVGVVHGFLQSFHAFVGAYEISAGFRSCINTRIR